MKILSSNKDYAICIKPVGLDSEHEVPAALKDALSGEVFPIHRLDKNVGGVMIYARNKAAAGQIVNQVQHFPPKLRLEFSNQDTSWGGY